MGGTPAWVSQVPEGIPRWDLRRVSEDYCFSDHFFSQEGDVSSPVYLVALG